MACWCAAGPASAQGLSLVQAFDAARTYDPLYLGALREYEASQEHRVQGQSALGTEVALTGSVARNNLDLKAGAFSRSQDYPSNAVAIQLRRPLFNPELQARSREGEARSREGEAALADRLGDLLVRVVEAYAEVPLAQEQVRTATALASAYEEQVRSTARNRTLGEGTITDELEARSRLALARARLVEASNARTDALARLRSIVGPIQPEPRALTLSFTGLQLIPAESSAWETMALEKSPKIGARRYALEAAREALNGVMDSGKPKVNLLASVSKADSESINTVNQSTLLRSVGFQLNVPLYDSGRTSSQARQAAAGVGAAEAALDGARDAVLAEVRRYHAKLLAEQEKVAAYREGVETATAQVRATEQSRRGGLRTTLDVLNAQSQRFTAQQELTQARFNHLKAWVRLRAVAGALTIDDLAEVDRYLQ